jgi:tetratricopeptide (TPR) repeat protein
VEPISALLAPLLSTAFDGFVGNRADAVLWKACGMGLRIFIQQRGDRSTNHDLERSVLRCYLLAQQSVAQESLTKLQTTVTNLMYTPDTPDVKWIQRKQKALATELKGMEKRTDFAIPQKSLDEIADLILPNGEFNETRLEASRKTLIEAVLADPATPTVFKEEAERSLLVWTHAYFAYEIKTNPVVRDIFSAQLLAQINGQSNEIKATLSQLEKGLLAYAGQVPEISPKLEAMDLLLRKIDGDLEGGFANVLAKVTSLEEGQQEVLQAVLSGNQTIDAIYEIVKENKRLLEQRQGAQFAVCPENIPQGNIVEFVGRDQAMSELENLLKGEGTIAITAIAGMGGLGKTELARQYALKHRETYTGGICWLKCRNQDISTPLLSFARTQLELTFPEQLNAEEKIAYLWQHWNTGNVLIVFDDVTDYAKVSAYLPPQGKQFKVLVTTRKTLGAGIRSLELDILSEESAVALLRSLVGSARIDESLDDAKRFCKWLGYLPLGLELVGRYLARKLDWSTKKMLEQLQKNRLEDKSIATPIDPNMNAKLGVSKALELDWEELDEPSKMLACLLSIFAQAPIPWELVERASSDILSEDLEDLRDMSLVSLHLLNRTGQGQYSLHQLVREFLQQQCKTMDLEESLQQAFAQVLIEEAKSVPERPALLFIAQFNSTTPHLIELANLTFQKPKLLSSNNLVWPFVSLGRFYGGQGDFTQSQHWRELCLIVTEKVLGSEHSDAALSFNNLAALYQNQGKYEQAELLYTRALLIYEKVLGPEHLDVGTTLNNLAALYDIRGKYGQAELLYARALLIRKKVLGSEHPDVGITLNNLAALYRIQGKYEQAEPLFVKSLELFQKALGAEHPDVATSLNNFALLCQSQGKYEQAEILYTRALLIREKVLGTEHPELSQSLNNLAELHRIQGKYKQAEPLHNRALLIRERVFGAEHPDVATSLNNFALLYQSQGKYEQAEPLHNRALLIREKILGEEHPDTATSLNNLAGLYDSQGKDEQAEPLYTRALLIREKVFGAVHPSVAMTLNNLAVLYENQEKYEQAKPLFTRALEILEKVLGSTHPSVATSLNNLAALCKSQGKYGEAEPLYNRALAILERKLGINHPNTVAVRENLQVLRDLYQQQRDKEAKLALDELTQMSQDLGFYSLEAVNEAVQEDGHD